MEEIILTRWEKRLLYAIKKYPYADIGEQELHGYFKFPPIETTLRAIGGLKSKGLIQEKKIFNHGYELTEAGKQYLLRHSFIFFCSNHAIQILITIVGGLIVAMLSRWFGLI